MTLCGCRATSQVQTRAHLRFGIESGNMFVLTVVFALRLVLLEGGADGTIYVCSCSSNDELRLCVLQHATILKATDCHGRPRTTGPGFVTGIEEGALNNFIGVIMERTTLTCKDVRNVQTPLLIMDNSVHPYAQFNNNINDKNRSNANTGKTGQKIAFRSVSVLPFLVVPIRAIFSNASSAADSRYNFEVYLCKLFASCVLLITVSQSYMSRICSCTDRKGWLVGCFGFNGPLRQYFSLYRAVSRRGGERGEKG